MIIKEQIVELLKSTTRTGINNLIDWLVNSDFFTAPASSKFHGNYEGGLAEHSYKVMKIYKKLSTTFDKKIDNDSIIIAGLMHDICKANFYTTEKRNRKVDGKWESYDCYIIDDKEPLGHGSKSVIILSKFIELKEIEVYSILWHMGKPSDYIESMSFNNAIGVYPEIILLHVADFISSTLYEKKIT